MRRYLLDSRPLAGLLNGREPFVSQHQPLLQRAELATSILVYAEVVEYLMGTSDSPRRQRLPGKRRPTSASTDPRYPAGTSAHEAKWLGE
jgi:hypothetical protein